MLVPARLAAVANRGEFMNTLNINRWAERTYGKP